MMDLQKIINEVRNSLFKIQIEPRLEGTLNAIGRINHRLFFGEEHPITVGELHTLNYLESISARTGLFMPSFAIPRPTLYVEKEGYLTVSVTLPQSRGSDAEIDVSINPPVLEQPLLRVVYAVEREPGVYSLLWDSSVPKTELKGYIVEEDVPLELDTDKCVVFNNKHFYITDDLIVVKVPVEVLIAGYYSRHLRGCGELAAPYGVLGKGSITESTAVGLTKVYGENFIEKYALVVNKEAKKPTGRKSKTTKK